MTCALCQLEKPLLQSHIIPEFLHRALYDEKHRFHVISALPGELPEYKQKGEREPLLCGDCESLFSKYERYGSLVLHGGTPLTARQDGTLLLLAGIDYKQFKLFQMSILWRAGVSSLPFFERVSLGPHQERLRTLLLSEDPGQPEQYGCIMWGLSMIPGQTPALFMQPTRVRNQGFITYKFVFAGLVWVFFVTKEPLRYPLDRCVLQANGETVVQMRSVAEMQDLKAFFVAAQKSGNI